MTSSAVGTSATTPTDEGSRPDTGRDVAFWATFALLSVLALAPIWTIGYLPMVDLPQHAAQVSIWRHWHEDPYGYRDVYEPNWFTPYLLAYSLARLLAFAVPVLVAFKIILSLAIVALPLTLLLLLRNVDADPWWSLVAFPLGYSYSFYWGFVNFVLATPLVLLFWWATLSLTRRPTVARALGLAVFAHGMFFTHALLFCFAIGSAALLVIAPRPPLRFAVLQLLPLASPAPFVLGWLARVRTTDPMTHLAPVWQLSSERLAAVGGLVFGGTPSAVSYATLGAVLAIPLLARARPSREPQLWAIAACCLGAYLLLPFEYMGTAFLYPRFAVFLVPAYLLAMSRVPDRAAAARFRFLPPLLAVALLVSLTLRFHGFQREVGGLDRILAAMEPGRRALSLVFDRTSAYTAAPVFVHFGAWYQSQRGGIADFSFASFFPAIFKYPVDRRPALPALFEWRPELFRWERHGGESYDYFLVRSRADVGSFVFGTAAARVRLEAQHGPWWLYRRTGSDLDAPASFGAGASPPRAEEVPGGDSARRQRPDGSSAR